MTLPAKIATLVPCSQLYLLVTFLKKNPQQSTKSLKFTLILYKILITMKQKIFFWFFALAFVIFSGSCKKEGKVELQFNQNVDGAALVLDSMIYQSSTTHKYSVLNLRYYLSRINIIDEDGGKVELAKYHLRDIHDEKTKRIIVDNVPPGTYKKINFIYGFTKEDNVDGFAENTIENQNMIWPSQLGPGALHYMKYEGQFDYNNTGELRGFAIHTGPTFGNDNSFPVSLDLGDLEVDNNTVTIDLQMNLGEWIKNPFDFDLDRTTVGIMPIQSAQDTVKANGATVFSVK